MHSAKEPGPVSNKSLLRRSSIEEPANAPKSQHPSLSPLAILPSLADASSRTSSNASERVRQLLEPLEGYDSLYLCPTDKPFPDVVANRIQHHCVYKYEVKDYYGVTRYYAAELTSRLCYMCCSNTRSFRIYMYEPSGDLVFESVRVYNSTLCITGVDSCCFIGGVETMANFRNKDNYIGSVLSNVTCTTPVYRVQNEAWNEKYYIRGPSLGFIFPCRLCCIAQFSICLPKTHISVGKIRYGYDGLREELIPNPKTVGVIFPPNCSPEIKACLLAAGFMVDVTFYQQRGFTLHRIFRYCCHLFMIVAFFSTCYLIFVYYMQQQN